MSDLHFSQASSATDYKQIAEINTQHLNSPDENGFLIIRLDETEISRLAHENSIEFYTARDSNDEIQGYVVAATEFDMSLVDSMQWVSSSLKSKTLDALSGKHLYIKQLAVRKQSQGLGVGSFLYAQLERNLGLPIIAFVAETPRQNEPSLRFHIKHKFIEVGTLYRAQFGKFTDYYSRMFVKF